MTQKYGVELLASVSYAKRLDEMNGNNPQMDVIKWEMENLKVTFDILDNGSNILVSYKKVTGHLVLNVRMKLE